MFERARVPPRTLSASFCWRSPQDQALVADLADCRQVTQSADQEVDYTILNNGFARPTPRDGCRPGLMGPAERT